MWLRMFFSVDNLVFPNFDANDYADGGSATHRAGQADLLSSIIGACSFSPICSPPFHTATQLRSTFGATAGDYAFIGQDEFRGYVINVGTGGTLIDPGSQPASITLLGTALLGLGAVYLRRRPA